MGVSWFIFHKNPTLRMSDTMVLMEHREDWEFLHFPSLFSAFQHPIYDIALEIYYGDTGIIGIYSTFDTCIFIPAISNIGPVTFLSCSISINALCPADNQLSPVQVPSA